MIYIYIYYYILLYIIHKYFNSRNPYWLGFKFQPYVLFFSLKPYWLDGDPNDKHDQPMTTPGEVHHVDGS